MYLNLLIIERFLLEFDDKESEQAALDSEVNNNAESPSLYQKSLEKLKLLTASSERLDKVAGPELDNTEALAQAQEEASSFYQKPFVALRNYGSSVITSYRSAQDLPRVSGFRCGPLKWDMPKAQLKLAKRVKSKQIAGLN